MDRTALIERLGYFDADVEAGERRVAEQQVLIAGLAEKGLRTYEAWATLHALEAALAVLIADRERLRQRLARIDGQQGQSAEFGATVQRLGLAERRNGVFQERFNALEERLHWAFVAGAQRRLARHNRLG